MKNKKAEHNLWHRYADFRSGHQAKAAPYFYIEKFEERNRDFK
jgi:hypothetical protein